MRKINLVIVGLLLVFVGSVVLDQVSKLHVQQDLLRWESGEDVQLYSGRSIALGEWGGSPVEPWNLWFAMNLTYSRNTGAAFSMLSDLDDRIRVPFFYGVTIFAVIAIVLFFRSTPIDQRFTRFGLVLILSGAIGNFLDRLRWGYVVDFLDVEWNLLGWRHDFAIFNVADVAINIGVICYLIDVFRLWRIEKRTAREAKLSAAASA
jgi:signal peptidase II